MLLYDQETFVLLNSFIAVNSCFAIKGFIKSGCQITAEHKLTNSTHTTDRAQSRTTRADTAPAEPGSGHRCTAGMEEWITGTGHLAVHTALPQNLDRNRNTAGS
jgi:hypothetical protein